MKPSDKLLFSEVAPSFRDVADLIEGIDCLSAVTKREENPELRKRLFKILKRIDKVDCEYYRESE